MCWKWDGQRWEIITLKQWCQHLLCTEVGYDYQNHHKGIFVHKIVCGLKPQFTIIQHFLWLFSFKWYHVLVKIVTGWSGGLEQRGNKAWSALAALLNPYQQFSPFRRSKKVFLNLDRRWMFMDLSGRVLILKMRPSWPIGGEHLRISTNGRPGPVTMPQSVRVRWGPGMSWLTLPQTTQTQFLMESDDVMWGMRGDYTDIISLTLKIWFQNSPPVFILETDPTRPTLLGVIRWSKSGIIISGAHAMNPLTAKETRNFTSFIADDHDGSCISGMRIVLMILIVIWTGSAQSPWHLDEYHSEIWLMLGMVTICHWPDHNTDRWLQAQQCLSSRNQKLHSFIWNS